MGFWEEVQGEQPPKMCGNCHWCERYDKETGALYDPWAEVEEPLRSELREKLGICDEESGGPMAVHLDGEMPCEGYAWARRYA